MSWHKKLGYYENPFTIKPMSETTKLYGQQQQLEDALYYIASGSVVFIKANSGLGKTKFLRTIINEFRGKIIYLDGRNLIKNINIEELLRKKNGMKGSVFGVKPKDMILIVDNVDELSRVNTERLKYYYDQGFLQSIVFSGASLDAKNISQSMVNRIGKRVIELEPLTKEQAVALAYERLDEDAGDEDPLITQAQIEKIFAKSSSTKEFLVNLHRVFEEMDFEDESSIQDKFLEVLNDSLDTEEEDEYQESLGVDKGLGLKDKYGDELLVLGEYYRSKSQDICCGNCGAIVELTDEICPECGAEFENYVTDEKDMEGEAHA